MTGLGVRALTVLALAALAGGCATATKGYTLIEPRATAIGEAYVVEPRLRWSSVSTGKVETWTIDGFALQRLAFFKGIEDGEPMTAPAKADDKRPRFRAALTPSEIAELVVESLYGGRLTPKDLRPAPFGGVPGFRFELAYHTREGVSRQALVAGAVLNNRLHVIVYDGTALHHFGKYREEAERVIASIRLK
jgi:hypothetical protein